MNIHLSISKQNLSLDTRKKTPTLNHRGEIDGTKDNICDATI